NNRLAKAALDPLRRWSDKGSAAYSRAAPARSDVRFAPKRSTFPETRINRAAGDGQIIKNSTGSNRKNGDEEDFSAASVASSSNRGTPASNNGLAAGTRYHAVVNAVCAVGRAEPGVP